MCVLPPLPEGVCGTVTPASSLPHSKALLSLGSPAGWPLPAPYAEEKQLRFRESWSRDQGPLLAGCDRLERGWAL